MTWIARLLVRLLGLSQGRAEKMAPWAVAGLLCVSAVTGGLLWLHFHDRQVVVTHDTAANLKAMRGQATADAHAADQRVTDVLANQQEKEAYGKAISSPAPGDSADPRVRLNCERLRRAGEDTKSIPACGGR